MYVIKFMKPFVYPELTMIGKDKTFMFKNSRKKRNFEVSFDGVCKMYKHANSSKCYAGYYLEVKKIFSFELKVTKPML